MTIEKYRLRYTNLFEKRIKSLGKNKALLGELGKKIEKLQSDPFFGKPLRYRLAGYRSLRVKGKYRLIYKINEAEKEVTLVAFGHRRAVYDILAVFTGER